MKKIGWLLLISLILFSVLEGSGWADLGIEAWTETYDGGYGNDYGQDITFDSLGNVIIAGYVTGDPGPPDHVTNAYAIKYTPAGVEDWSVEFDSGPIGEGGGQDGHDSFYDVAVDSLNNMIFVGSRAEIWPTVPTNQSLFIQKYNSSGLNLQWEERWYGYGWVGAQGVAVDASDNIYVAGSDFVDWGSTQGAWLTMKYNSAGVISLGPIYYDYNNYSFLQDRAYDVTLDSEGNIISVGVLGVSGCDGCLYNDGDWHVRKYDSAGTLVWEDTYSGAANLIDYAVGVDVDSSNNVIVCGYSNKGTDNSTNADYDWLVIKYAKNGDGGVGQRLWTYTYESTMGRSEMASAVKIDQSDNIFVVGSEKDGLDVSHWRLAKLNSANGALIDDQRLNSAVEGGAAGLALSTTGVAVTGWTDNGTDRDITTTLLLFKPQAFKLDLKVNGLDDKVTVAPTQNVSVTLSLSAGEFEELPVEWWVGALTTSFGNYWFNSTGQWTKTMTPYYQGPLEDLPETDILNLNLPLGVYKFFTLIETNMDEEFNPVKNFSREDDVRVYSKQSP